MKCSKNPTVTFQAFFASNSNESCEHRTSLNWRKSTQSLHTGTLERKKSNKSNLQSKSKIQSLNGSPSKGNNHVRFTPDTKDEDCCFNFQTKIEMVHCKLITTDEVLKAVKQSPIKVMIKSKSHQNGVMHLNGMNGTLV